MEGWIKIYRKISDNPLWTLEPFTKGQAWVDLLLIANHKEGQISVRGNIIPVKRGQVGWSEVKLAERWKWSRNKVRRFLKHLETEQQIEQHKNSVSSIITIVNYELYQETIQQKGQQTIQQKDSRRNTNKNDKNDKEELPPKDSSPTQFEKIQKLWIKTIGRNPRYPEVEETERLIAKFGEKKVEKIFREATLRNVKTMKFILDNIDQHTGEFIPFQPSNGKAQQPRRELPDL